MSRLGYLMVMAIAAAQPAFAKKPTKAKIAVSCSANGHLWRLKVADREEVVTERDLDVVVKRLLPDRDTDIIITNTVDTSWRCIGGLIYTLQRIGYRRVGFISEPPPAKR